MNEKNINEKNNTSTSLILGRFKNETWVQQMWADPLGKAGIIILVAVILISIIGPIVFPFDSKAGDSVEGVFRPPSSVHWLGTDDMGRDIFRATLTGAQVSLFVGLTASAISIIVGAIVGLLSGYYFGFGSNLSMRVTDFFFRSTSASADYCPCFYLWPEYIYYHFSNRTDKLAIHCKNCTVTGTQYSGI